MSVYCLTCSSGKHSACVFTQHCNETNSLHHPVASLLINKAVLEVNAPLWPGGRCSFIGVVTDVDLVTWSSAVTGVQQKGVGCLRASTQHLRLATAARVRCTFLLKRSCVIVICTYFRTAAVGPTWRKPFRTWSRHFHFFSWCYSCHQIANRWQRKPFFSHSQAWLK